MSPPKLLQKHFPLLLVPVIMTQICPVQYRQCFGFTRTGSGTGRKPDPFRLGQRKIQKHRDCDRETLASNKETQKVSRIFWQES